MCKLTSLSRMFASAFVVLALSGMAGQALAVDPVHVSVTLEGCKNTGQNPLYISNFICADSVYTSGNLGKGWNELDLVPYRLTTDLGTQATATTTYSVVIVLDNADGSPLKPGYDVISVPVVNAALSDASCSVSAVPSTGAGAIKTPGIGGTAKSIYRTLTITQDKGTTCVFDYYGRLALGSHLFPGASLHANLTLADFSTGGIGARDVSIPVNEILAQELRKDMTAQQAVDFIWSVSKQGSSAVHFGDVCAIDPPSSLPVDITVTWTKGSAVPGNTTVITHVYANNPASRTITVSGNDKIYKSLLLQSSLLSTTLFGPTDVPAGTELLVLTNSQSFTPAQSNEGAFNDVATASYVDLATGIPIPGTTTATASAPITGGTASNTTASISDTESISGTGLLFSVAAPSVGGFLDGYVAGTQTTGPVGWEVLGVSSSGSITFNKTVYLNPLTVVTDGKLTDTATLTTSGGSATEADLTINIDSSASVKLTINKTLPFSLNTGETIKMTFTLAGSGPSITQELDIVGPYTAGDTASVTVDNLAPDNYAVSESDCKFIDAANPDPGIACNLAPNNTPVNVDLSLTEGGVATCSGHADFTNVAAQVPTAAVVKVTDPSCDPDNKSAFTWSFTLTGPNGYSQTVEANSCDGGVSFGNLADGAYTMTETLRSGWDFNQVTEPDGDVIEQNSCQFTVHVASDGAKVFTCTFKNTQRGGVSVTKTVNGSSTFSQSFTFDLRTGASAGVPGTVIEGPTVLNQANNPISFTNLVPGSYQLCESGILPGWSVSFTGYTTFSPSVDPNDNSTLCVDVTVPAGGTLAVTVDNSPPPGGEARTIGYWKNWASCSGSKGKQAFVLDQTLALFPIGSGQSTHGFLVGTLYVDTCSEAVSLLNKSALTGKKMASDPLFNLAAQFVAAKLNIQSGAASCATVSSTIASAQTLFVKYSFNGKTHTAMTKADAALANMLASILDTYNNNTLAGCP